ncbi:MAG: hypothetical protein HY681_08760 [Chloroflexi bacterium]|nr:hypothetical protein [Chloroflexota bacterium]
MQKSRQTPRPRARAFGYGLFVAMFFVPAVAMLVYLAGAIASAGVDARTASAARAGETQARADETRLQASQAWERAALYVCPLH